MMTREKREFHDLVLRLAKEGETTILLTTHDLDEAEKLADRTVILNGGWILADGTAEELSTSAQSARTAPCVPRPSRTGSAATSSASWSRCRGTILAYLVILLIPGLRIVDGLDVGSIGSWLMLAWVLLLGLVATQSVGAMLGALISGPRGAGYLSPPVMGLVAISGIFYPITALPGWLQGTAQAFPMYWLGLGMRLALLPAAAVSVELGGSWRHLETIAVLGA